MPVFRVHPYSSDYQLVSAKYSKNVHEIHVLKLSKSMFEIVKHTL